MKIDFNVHFQGQNVDESMKSFVLCTAQREDMLFVICIVGICLFVMKKVWILDKNLTERGKEQGNLCLL